uniref:Rieske domain-containing protein n=1 Tax=Arion vulgaris TaxID=1028688 RepID=A0A0B7B893_9EUPU
MGQKQTKEDQSVKVVNIKIREDAQNVYPDTPVEQQNRPVSTTSEQKSPESQSPGNVGQTTQQTEDMIEAVVGSVTDFKNGEIQEVDVGDKKVLLVKEDDQFYAVSSKCTHYGAPLSKGAYCKGIVRCPWHGACFNVKTGDIEDYPGLDSLQKYKVVVTDGKVIVQADAAALENAKRIKPMVKKSADNKKTVVLVGGGPATLVCAETLRQEGYTGKIILVSQESCLPYDRIKLSKALSITPGEIALRSQEFYDQNGIELVLGRQVTKVESENKKILLDNGQSLTYDTLVVATGGSLAFYQFLVQI